MFTLLHVTPYGTPEDDGVGYFFSLSPVHTRIGTSLSHTHGRRVQAKRVPLARNSCCAPLRVYVYTQRRTESSLESSIRLAFSFFLALLLKKHTEEVVVRIQPPGEICSLFRPAAAAARRERGKGEGEVEESFFLRHHPPDRAGRPSNPLTRRTGRAIFPHFGPGSVAVSAPVCLRVRGR